jgi:hypothetical protein
MRKVVLVLFVLAGLTLLLGPSQGPSAAAQPPSKLSGALQRLLDLWTAGGLSAAQAYGQTQGIHIQGADGRLVVVVEGAGDLSDQIRAQGGVLQAKYKGLWQAEVPLGNLTALSQAAVVSFIRLPQVALTPSPIPLASAAPVGAPGVGVSLSAQAGPITSEGVALIGAEQLHAQGIRGQGVKIGVIDLGFAGLDRMIQRGELPQTLVAWNCMSGRCRRVSAAELASVVTEAGAHGTAVAEIVHDVAPDAVLHLFLISTEVELGQAMTQATDEGVRVINHSVAWFNDGSFYDGRGVIGDIVRSARQNGVFWVNAAGNFARAHYQATFSDGNGDRYHDTDIVLELQARQPIQAIFTWDDWQRAQEDFDLVLMKGDKIEKVSNNRPDGRTLDERIFFTAPEAGSYRLRIHWPGPSAAPSNRKLELFVQGVAELRPSVSESSLPEPANAQEAFAVGAVGVSQWESGELEPFSSWGPTNDGRAKPDLVAPDCVRTASSEAADSASVCGAGGRFAGTSAAAPHIAGAAALLLSEDPKRTPAEVERLLRERARPARGTPNQVGAGKASLIAPEALPDLLIASADVEPREVQAGTATTVRVRARVRNAGAGSAGAFWVGLWRADEVGRSGRELASARVSGGLAAGAEQEIVLEWSVSAQEPPGEKKLVVVADPFGDVRERDKTNNRSELTVRVAPAAWVPPPVRTLGFGDVTSVVFSPDGRYLAVGTWGGSSVQLIDTSRWQVIRTFEGHTGGVTSVAFSPDGRLLASGSYDATIKLWDISDLVGR